MNQDEMVLELLNRVEKLEKEVNLLKAQQGIHVVAPMQKDETVETVETVETASATVASEQTPVNEQVVLPTEMLSQGFDAQPTTSVKSSATSVKPPVAQTQPQKVQPAKPKQQNMESKIGKNLMGVLASVLIFFSVFLFGIVIYDILPDVAKVGVIFLVSTAFAVVGLLKMKKESKYYVFFTSLAACGIGAYYILFMLMYFAYQMIPVWGLAIALFLWTIVVSVIARMKSKVFTFICYAGTTISVFLCCVQWPISFISLGFYLFSMFMIFGLGMSKIYRKNAFAFLQFPVMAMILAQFYGDSPVSLIVLMLLVVGACIAQHLFFELDRNDASVMVFVQFLTMISLSVISVRLHDYADDNWFSTGAFTGGNLAVLIYAALFIALVCVNCFRNMQEHKELFYMTYYPAIVVLPNLTYFTGQKEYVGFLLIYIVLLLLGCFADNKHFRIPGYVYFIMYIIWRPENVNYGVVFALGIVTVAALIVWVKNNYEVVDKYFVTVSILALLMMLRVDRLIDGALFFILLAGVSFVLNSPIFRLNADTGEEEASSKALGYAMNAIMMIVGATLIRTHDAPFTIVTELPSTEMIALVMVVLVTIGLFFINVKRLFELKLPEMLVGIYICLKFTILTFTILGRIGTTSYLNSVAGLLIAIAFIVLGFKLSRKPYRLYGLVLTLLCVAKLILFDVQYSSNIFRPVGFFFAGILCFAISWLYSMLEKRESQAKEEMTEKVESE